MAITEIFFWWYISGWNVFIKKVRNWFSSVADFFSMDSLIRTLFKPYRQISAETTSDSGSLDLKLHMFLDRLISRIVGFFSRLILLITGTILISIIGIASLVLIVLWPILPLLPVVGIILTIIGLTI